jgi:hypothetical protein
VDFGADGPVFRLKAMPADPVMPKKRRQLAVAALALLAVAGGAAVWSLGPWAGKSGAPGSLPGTEAIELAGAPALTPSPKSDFAPAAAPDPAMPVQDLPPRHFPNSPAPDIPADTDQPPNIGTAQKAPKFSAPVFSIAAPAVIAAAPSPPPAPEPEPPWPDPVVRWVGPLAALKPSGISTLPVLQANFMALMPRPTWRGKVSLIANNISSSETPEPAPMVQLPPAEPVETAIEAIKPIAPEPVAPVIVLATSDVVEWTEQSKVAASAEPATPLILSELIWAISTPFPAPIPLPRPRHTDPVGDSAGIVEKQPVAAETQSVARAMPVPRPSRARAPEIQPNAPIAATPPGSGPETQIKTNLEYSDEPTKYASATSPVPTSRPALSTRTRGFPSPAILPALSGEANASIGSAATEPGMPLGITMLVGILNLETGRRALLRLPDGSYHFVIVGDVLDGWRVSMIGVDAMRITRSGEDRTLLMINR